MHQLLVYIENTEFSVWVRESPSMFAYTGLLSLHAMGLAFAVGFGWFIALRLLGFVPLVPIASLRPLFPIMWLGFWINFASGVPLLMANATHDLTSPVFLTKITVVALAAMTMLVLRRDAFKDPAAAEPRSRDRKTRRLAGAAIFFWMTAIVAGRLSEYPWLFGMPSR